MTAHLPEILAIAIAVLTGGGVVLKVVAPMTATDLDDRTLTFSQHVLLPLRRPLR